MENRVRLSLPFYYTERAESTITVNLFGFFFHAIPSEGVLTLEDMHAIVRDIWITRFDSELETERATRRKGRPKSTKEQHLEGLKEREVEEYRTGLGTPSEYLSRKLPF